MANQETINKRDLNCEECGQKTYKFFKIKETYIDKEENRKVRIKRKLCKKCFKEEMKNVRKKEKR